ncbi:hypothetical protein POX_c04036 [Penicillium oxalicum]|uniref:hypothetical protein n=1 Tax=Penicillium oxalicum TaxID=69781 RepID=UPI0020B89AA0|nr:hypothetical protein POX_c04036 [Penicillium oxalicum]KAI2791180.1 hypothetical protein POX_c04036 [Penicillium oxalicum]
MPINTKWLTVQSPNPAILALVPLLFDYLSAKTSFYQRAGSHREMEATDEVAIVVPDPSFPEETYKDYKPFPDAVQKTIDEILAEEESLEEGRSHQWPFYSGADQYDESSFFTSSYGQTPPPVKRSPVSTRSKIKGKQHKTLNTTEARKKRSTATRTITVVDLCSDGDEQATDGMSFKDDKHRRDSEVEDAYFNTTEVTASLSTQPQASHSIQSRPFDVKHGKTEILRGSDEMTIAEPKNLGNNDGKTAADNVAPASPSAKVSVKTLSLSRQDYEEESSIFRNVKKSTKRRILRFIAAHPFMSHSVQPVWRSERQQFIKDMVAEAVKLGLETSLLWSLIMYVRRLYLVRVGVEAGPIADDTNDPCFGQEVDDTASKPSTSQICQRKIPGHGPASSQHDMTKVTARADEKTAPMRDLTCIATDVPTPPLSAPLTTAFDERTDDVNKDPVCKQPNSEFTYCSDHGMKNHGKTEAPLSIKTASKPCSLLTEAQLRQNDDPAAIADPIKSFDDAPWETTGIPEVSYSFDVSHEKLTESKQPLKFVPSKSSKHERNQGPSSACNYPAMSEPEIGASEPQCLTLHEKSAQTSDRTSSDQLSAQTASKSQASAIAKMSERQEQKSRRRMIEVARKTFDGMPASSPLQAAGDLAISDQPAKKREGSTSVTSLNCHSNRELLAGTTSAPVTGPDANQGQEMPSLGLDEPVSNVAQSMSKSQKRKERKRLKREKKQLKYQQKKSRRQEAQEESTSNEPDRSPENTFREKPVLTGKAPVLSSKPLTIDTEPRKARKRKDCAQKLEKKKERKRKRKSRRREMGSSSSNGNRGHGDLLSDGEENGTEAPNRAIENHRSKRRKLESPVDSLHLFGTTNTGLSTPAHDSMRIRKNPEDRISYSENKPDSQLLDFQDERPRIPGNVRDLHADLAVPPDKATKLQRPRQSLATTFSAPSRSAGSPRSRSSGLSPDMEEVRDEDF